MGNNQKMLSVVVPAFNEEVRLRVSLPAFCDLAASFFPKFEIIVVDDGSSDKTTDLVLSYARQHSCIRLIRYEKNRGKGYAVRTGMLASKGDLVLFSDADLSTPFTEIKKLLSALECGADVAIGSRAVKESVLVKRQPLYRMLMGKTFNKFVQFLATPGIFDSQCGFKLFTKTAALNIFNDCQVNGFGFDVEVLFLARKRGFLIQEVGVDWINDSDSRVNPITDSARMLRDLFIIRRNALLGYYGDLSGQRPEINTASSE